jgi:hypothetical protein
MVGIDLGGDHYPKNSSLNRPSVLEWLTVIN